MIIALLALAFAMIFGGLLAAFFGWDIVLIERGWTMVIAGSFSAASGALLLGITAAVSKLAQIQSELTRLQIGLEEEGQVQEEAPASSTGLSLAALAGGLLGGKLFGRSESKDKGEKQGDLPLFAGDARLEPAVEPSEVREEYEAPRASAPFMPFPPRTGVEEAESRDEGAAEVKVPDFLLVERESEPYTEVRTEQVEVSLFGAEPVLEEFEERLAVAVVQDDILESVPESAVAAEPEPAHAPEEAAATEETAREGTTPEAPRSDATVIGTYNSGDNTYVMFSDGSIEAQTPSGVFRFQSLDELKAFIASGGEGPTTASI